MSTFPDGIIRTDNECYQLGSGALNNSEIDNAKIREPAQISSLLTPPPSAPSTTIPIPIDVKSDTTVDTRPTDLSVTKNSTFK